MNKEICYARIVEKFEDVYVFVFLADKCVQGIENGSINKAYA